MFCDRSGNLGRIRVALMYFLISLSYFTRIPVLNWISYPNNKDLQNVMCCFSLVGVCIGVYSSLIYLAALYLWPRSISVGISMAATLLATGALHEDGLADSCDAFGGGYTRDEILKIMNDSQIGTFGALALVITLGLKWQSLVLMPPMRAALTLISAHVGSRAMVTSFLLTLNYVKTEGKAKLIAYRIHAGMYRAIMICSLPFLFLTDWRSGITSIILLVVVRLCLARYFIWRIGGYTGDCLGFAQQLGELTIYLTSLGWISF